MLTAGSPSGANLNFEALVRPMSRKAAREMAGASGMPAGASDGNAWALLLYRMSVAALLVAGAVAGILLTGAVFSENAATGQPLPIFPGVIGVLFAVVLFVALAGYIVRVAFRIDVPRLGAVVRRVRLHMFAMANPPMALMPELAKPPYQGIPFTSTLYPVVYDVIRTQFQLPVEIGNLRFSGTAKDPRAAIVRGYLRIGLGRALPHMVLVSKRDRDNTAIIVAVRDDQTLSLEGDFDRHFTLYVPREYERDALYVFTPDLMEILIDEAGQFDVEIVGPWLNIYSHQPLRMLDPETYLLASRLVERLGAKAFRQTARYSDDRVPLQSSIAPPGFGTVAPQGRRLHANFRLTIIFAGVGAAIGGVLVPFLLR